MDVIQQRAISLSRRRFLLRCRTYDNLPSHIYNIKNRLENHHFNVLSRKNYYNKTYKFAKHLLNLEIKELCLHLTYLEKESGIVIKKIYRSNIDKDI